MAGKDVGKDNEISGSPMKSIFRRSRNVISNEEMWVWLELKNLSGALKKLAISLKYIGFLFQTQLTIGQSLTTATLNSLAHHCELAWFFSVSYSSFCIKQFSQKIWLLLESVLLRLGKLKQFPIMPASQWCFSHENFFSIRQVLRRFFQAV